MIQPKTLEELAPLIESNQRLVLVFMTDWCPDCHYLAPYLPEIEAAFPASTFVELDRDAFMPLAQQWDIFGIPSLVVLENGQEIGRLVNKARKTKAEIIAFLEGLETK
ncbi:thioredoxin family protein [Streptococcus moroccensis]|uniref:Thiol-disulfide isomerase/thioredoxin n=1 Tax=Streptococcus moroccensis TaxID=1451356 RepID=A0ABT9YS75_9STRE|nr:thioredoxin family protein [Streptococcus moroccensis]MDQ0222854.1 thiol-disulfide isomerase/thioredoxin [Streptococcus moroccensis]